MKYRIETPQKKTRWLPYALVALLALSGLIAVCAKKTNDNVLGQTFLEILMPLHEGMNHATAKVGSGLGKIFQKDPKTQVQRLEEEIEELRTQLIFNTLTKQDIKQLEELKGALHFSAQSLPQGYISTSIVAKNDGLFYTSFTLASGRKDQVQSGSIVVNGKGLVGKVYELSDHYCKAITLLDAQSSLSFQLLNDPAGIGIASQNIIINGLKTKDGSLLRGYLFKREVPIKKDETVITSGLGLYPRGIPVGTVQDIVPDKNKLLNYITIKPFVDFTDLEKVMIVNPQIPR